MENSRRIPIRQRSLYRIRTLKTFEDLFPQVSNDCFMAIFQDMSVHGFDAAFPLVLAKGPWTEHPVLLDGHARLKAARYAHLQYVTVIEKTFPSRREAGLYWHRRQTNTDRRLFNIGQYSYHLYLYLDNL